MADLVETCKVLVRSIADDERILAQADEKETLHKQGKMKEDLHK